MVPTFACLQHQFLMDMHASFHHFDTDRSGTLEKHEVQRALEHSGAPPFTNG
jgi:Ca2+-binding EF-hand superfamily protein